MSGLKVGDRVRVPGTPGVVEVLEVSFCHECGGEDPETFRFNPSGSPRGCGAGWMHVTRVKKV